MITQFLEINTNAPFESVSDALAYGLPLSLLGLLIVFAVLALLWAILALFKVFFYGASTGKKKSELPAKKADVHESTNQHVVAPESVTAPATVVSAGTDEELVAVISAAIAAYRSACGEAVGSFRVVSFKRRK